MTDTQTDRRTQPIIVKDYYPQTVGGRVQPDAGRVDEGCGPQLRGVNCHSGVLDCRQGGAGPEEEGGDKNRSIF